MIFIFNFTFCVPLDSYGYFMLKLYTYSLGMHQSNTASLQNFYDGFEADQASFQII